MLDEVLKSNEATGKTVEAAEAAGTGASGANCGGECGAPAASAAQAASAGETALAEITPPEQFQNFYAFPPEQPQSGAASTGSLNKKTFSRSASVGNQVKLRQFLFLSTTKPLLLPMNFDNLMEKFQLNYGIGPILFHVILLPKLSL